jgi:hypothetical protein
VEGARAAGSSAPACSDLRSPLAKARDGFLLSQRGEELCAGTTSGQYLCNRIEAAWLAGAAWGQAHPRFVRLPYANASFDSPALKTHTCDECCEPDYQDALTGGEIRRFYRDAETGESVCEKCKAKREGKTQGGTAT